MVPIAVYCVECKKQMTETPVPNLYKCDGCNRLLAVAEVKETPTKPKPKAE